MKKAQTPEEIQTINTPVNPSIIIALRHMLAAVSNLQTVSSASKSEQILLAESHLLLRKNIRRLAGRGGAE